MNIGTEEKVKVTIGKKKCNEKEKEEEEKSCILNYRQQIDSKKVLISWPSKIGISLTLE